MAFAFAFAFGLGREGPESESETITFEGAVGASGFESHPTEIDEAARI